MVDINVKNDESNILSSRRSVLAKLISDNVIISARRPLGGEPPNLPN